MSAYTIDTAMAYRMVEAGSICGASTIRLPGDWFVKLRFGTTENRWSQW